MELTELRPGRAWRYERQRADTSRPRSGRPVTRSASRAEWYRFKPSTRKTQRLTFASRTGKTPGSQPRGGHGMYPGGRMHTVSHGTGLPSRTRCKCNPSASSSDACAAVRTSSQTSSANRGRGRPRPTPARRSWASPAVRRMDAHRATATSSACRPSYASAQSSLWSETTSASLRWAAGAPAPLTSEPVPHLVDTPARGRSSATMRSRRRPACSRSTPLW